MKYDRKTVFWQTKGLCLHDCIVQRKLKEQWGQGGTAGNLSPALSSRLKTDTFAEREKQQLYGEHVHNKAWAAALVQPIWLSSRSQGAHVDCVGRLWGKLAEAQSRFHEVTLRLTNIGKLISKDGSSISATRYWLTSFLWKGNEIKKGNKWIRNLHSHSDNKQLESGFILLTYSTGQGVCFCFSSKTLQIVPQWNRHRSVCPHRGTEFTQKPQQ